MTTIPCDLYAVLYTDGHINMQNIKYECQEQMWVPITTYKDNKESVVILCESDIIARNFSKRNLPSNWVKGSILLSPFDIDKIKDKFKIEIFKFPRKIKDQFELGFEIIELPVEPDLFYKYK